MTFLHRMTLKKHKMTWHSVASACHSIPRRTLNLISTEHYNMKKHNVLYLYSNFQLRVESNPWLLWFCPISLYDWSRNSPHALNQSDSTLKPTRFGHFPCYDWLLIEPHNEHRINAWHFMTWSNFAQKTWYYQLRYIKYFCTQAIGLSASQDRIFPG